MWAEASCLLLPAFAAQSRRTNQPNFGGCTLELFSKETSLTLLSIQCFEYW
jgi:hypothetical protein